MARASGAIALRGSLAAPGLRKGDGLSARVTAAGPHAKTGPSAVDVALGAFGALLGVVEFTLALGFGRVFVVVRQVFELVLELLLPRRTGQILGQILQVLRLAFRTASSHLPLQPFREPLALLG